MDTAANYRAFAQECRDRSPLDVTDDDDVRWLSCLVWPGEGDRAERLAAAAR